MAPRPQLRLLTAVFAVLMAIALGACGSSGPENGLTEEQADKLLAPLENLQGDVGDGDCVGAEAKLTSIRGDVDAIAAEGNVDKEIIDGLNELVDQTDTLLADCTESEETDETTSSSTTTSSESEPTTTETSTETEETDTTNTDPKPEEPEEEEPEPTEPPSGNGPPGPEGNPNDEGSFDPGAGGVSPGEKRSVQGGDREQGKSAGPGSRKRKMFDGEASQRADQESGTR